MLWVLSLQLCYANESNLIVGGPLVSTMWRQKREEKSETIKNVLTTYKYWKIVQEMWSYLYDEVFIFILYN